MGGKKEIYRDVQFFHGSIISVSSSITVWYYVESCGILSNILHVSLRDLKLFSPSRGPMIIILFSRVLNIIVKFGSNVV